MLRTLLLICLFLFSYSVQAQKESIFVHTDKKICNEADTIWFRAFLLTDSTTRPSSNFYLELYSQDTVMMDRKVFPVVNHDSFGQIEMPATAGYYWLRGYTLNATSEAIIAINVLPGDGPYVIVKQSSTPVKKECNDNIVSVTKEGEGYNIHVASKQKFSYSVSVTDVSDPGTPTLLTYPMPPFPRRWDTSGLVFHANLNKVNSKVNDLDIIMYLQTDSTKSSNTQLSINNGAVTFQDLYFYDNGSVHYQFSKNGKLIESNNHLNLMVDTFPVFTAPPLSGFKKETLDTKHRPSPNVQCEEAILSKRLSKTLKTVEVKSKWKDRHLALNKKYVMSDEFKAIEHYTFDLRTPMNAGSAYFVLDYLNRELPPNWYTSTLSTCREGIQCYVDEQPMNIEMVAKMPLQDFAYAKIYQDLHPPCPSICLYRRKGEDLNIAGATDNVLAIRGYSKPASWTQPDAITWLWNPRITSQSYHFSRPPKAFKVSIIGNAEDGSPLFYQGIFKD